MIPKIANEEELGRINALLAAYRDGSCDPHQILDQAYATLDQLEHCVIHRVDTAANHERLTSLSNELPLFGIPFVVKDNIDVAGCPTTAACPGYAYIAEQSASVVEYLLAAGAILLAKVNLDQFATGLVGTRSPYGTPVNPINKELIPGGSSSGSAVAVSAGAVMFSLGTDTAGSGRVPAAACNLVGLKATKGRFSTHSVVPACRSLDCVSIFAESCADAATVATVMNQFDPQDAFARQPATTAAKPIQRLGFLNKDDLVIDQDHYGAAYQRCKQQAQADQFEIVSTAYDIFAQAADLLYGGPWVAERYAAVGKDIEAGIDGLDPTVSKIISNGNKAGAVDVFTSSYQLAALKRKSEAVWQNLDVLVLPSVPGIPTCAEVAADPVGVNTRNGTYTNFVNLLDCCAVTFPVCDEINKLASITLVAPAWQEDALLALAAKWHPQLSQHPGASTRSICTAKPASLNLSSQECLDIAVIGLHLQGEPLHYQLTDRNATFVEASKTSPHYQLFAVDGEPSKPAMIRSSDNNGQAIELEIYAMPQDSWGSFIAGIKRPLGIGLIELADGRWVHGFLADAAGLTEATDITAFGGWRPYTHSVAMH